MTAMYRDPGALTLTEAIWGADLDAVTSERIAVVDGDREQTWSRREMAAATAALARHLLSVGIGEDDIVGVLLDNSAEFIVSFHGVLASGAVVLPLDPHAPANSWTDDLREHDVRVVIAGPQQLRQLSRLPADHPLRAAVITGPSAMPEADKRIQVTTWSEVQSCATTKMPLPPVKGGARTAVLGASSGTFGTPKKVVITHHNLVANLAQIDSVHRLDNEDVVLAVTPLRHIYGMQMVMNNALRTGATIVIGPPRYSLESLAAAITRHQVTVAYLVPSVIAELSAAQIIPDHRLRLLVSGGARLSASVAQKCSDTLGVPVVQSFGMTEAGCISFAPDEAAGPGTSVGVILPGTEARFVDSATARDAVAGQPGELWIRGPQVTPGYLNTPQAAAVPDQQGWLHTGDLAVLDPGGYLHIVGRIKNIIKYKGYQVAPAELEDILLTHPAITDAVVLGEPDPLAGEVPKAYVVVAQPVSMESVLAYVAERVSPHKKVRAVEQVPTIPRSGNGKVDRRALGAGAFGSQSPGDSGPTTRKVPV
jgi:acyl-CoA synthetase (AMP-forming)/AMP-acid ligase II